ncbi:uncharacterized protein LOC124374525, partial [Homalodisca vitripennis]|uniref:uncharacterized protein LOC124374525 n=1 Tax=Homalodisca vitripennis TaxID=197043 RepID=UPI001EEAD2AD
MTPRFQELGLRTASDTRRWNKKKKTIVSSISDDNPDFELEGYTVIGVCYSLLAASLFFGPYLNIAIGPKLTMIISAVGFMNLWGNLFVYYIFYGKQHIDQFTRRTVLYLLAGINILAIVSLMTLPKSSSESKTESYSPSKTVKKCFAILKSRKMHWLMFTFIYTGLQEAFGDGIYSPSIVIHFGIWNYGKELVALSGILMSIGSLI